MKYSIQVISDLLERYDRCLENSASEYGEPGYELEEGHKAILFANWNGIPKYLLHAIERQYDIQWSDEWLLSESGKAYRESPDSYGWAPSFVLLHECEVFGIDEIEADEDLLNDYLLSILDNSKKCSLLSKECLEKLGFKNYNGTFENGWHPGQTDDPEKILREYLIKFPRDEFVFANLSPSQFYIEFEIWGRPNVFHSYKWRS